MVKYFKKLSPATVVTLENESRIQFASLDGVLGYYGTQDAYVQEQFGKFMAQSRYSLSEISWDEFNRDYLQKKNHSTPLLPASREELVAGNKLKGSDPVETLGTAYVASRVGIDTPDPVKPAAVIAVPDAENKPHEFKPALGRRRKPASLPSAQL